MTQISLPLDWSRRAEGRDFLVSEANALAVRHVEGWRDWPSMTSIISGPRGSGRSTLGRLFARLSGGDVIDDAQAQADEMLFHAWNRAQTDHRPLLLIADAAPQGWTVTLPDLRSRLAAAPHIAIGDPDEALVIALLEQTLSRMGMAHAAELPAWLARRIERKYAVIGAIAECLNAVALSSGRKISVAMAKEALQSAGFLPILPSDGPS